MTQKSVHVALGIVCCKNGQTVQVLVTRRPEDTVLGGSWEFPGGKVEPGETPANAVVRELAEEVGLQVKPVKSLTTVDYVYEHARVHLHPWLCRQTGGQLKNLQVTDHQWVDISAISQVTLPPANDPILAELARVDWSTW